MRFRKIGLLVMLLAIAGFTVAHADDADVVVTSENNPPTIDSVTDLVSQDPGTSFSFQGNVTDTNGEQDIDSVVLTCWGPSSTEGDTDDWDHYTNSSPTVTNIDSDTNQYDFTITTDKHADDGSWTCEVYVNDSAGASDTSQDTWSMNTRIGIVLSASSGSSSALPGTNDVVVNNYDPETITHDGNIDLNVSVSGTDLTGVSDSSWSIPVDHLEYNDSNTLPGTNLSSTDALMLDFFNRGDPDTETANTSDWYWWVDIPEPLKAQDYSGTITYTAEAA